MAATNTKINCEDPLPQLIALVAFSRKHPDKFDWKKNCNEWQILFVDHILSLAKNIPNLELTEKQRKKVLECLERMTLI